MFNLRIRRRRAIETLWRSYATSTSFGWGWCLCLAGRSPYIKALYSKLISLIHVHCRRHDVIFVIN